MNKILPLLILAFSLSSCKTEVTKSSEQNTSTQIDVDSLEAEGFQLFQESPAKAISIFQQVSSIYLEEENHVKAGLTNLNIANIYDEYLGQPDSALHFANQSLSIWKSINDTLQQANLYKYTGLLKGQLGNFEMAKQDIEKAIGFYKAVQFEQGIAVSQFNLARIYFEEGTMQESKVLHERALAYWKSMNDKNRIFTNNLFGVELYSKLGDKKKVKKLLRENYDLSKSITLNDFLKNKFKELVNKHGDLN